MRTPINEIVHWIAAIAKTASRENAGRMALPDGEVVYIVDSDCSVATGEVGQIWTLGPRHLPQAADRILRLMRRKRR